MPSPSWPKLPPGALTRFQTSAQGGRARLSLRLRAAIGGRALRGHEKTKAAALARHGWR